MSGGSRGAELQPVLKDSRWACLPPPPSIGYFFRPGPAAAELPRRPVAPQRLRSFVGATSRILRLLPFPIAELNGPPSLLASHPDNMGQRCLPRHRRRSSAGHHLPAVAHPSEPFLEAALQDPSTSTGRTGTRSASQALREPPGSHMAGSDFSTDFRSLETTVTGPPVCWGLPETTRPGAEHRRRKYVFGPSPFFSSLPPPIY